MKGVAAIWWSGSGQGLTLRGVLSVTFTLLVNLYTRPRLTGRNMVIYSARRNQRRILPSLVCGLILSQETIENPSEAQGSSSWSLILRGLCAC